jgi:hypothetical protein
MLGAGVTPGAAAAGSSPALHTLVGTGVAGTLSSPTGIAIDGAGDLFIADSDHCQVLMIPDHAGTMYGMRVSAGRSYTVAGGPCGAKGGIGLPTGVAVDRHGDVFIAVPAEDRILLVRPGGTRRPRTPVTLAGTGLPGYSGNGLAAPQSRLNEPTGVAVDGSGDLFIADTANCRVRMVPSVSGPHFGQSMTAGHLYDLVGNGTCGSLGRPGAARTAQLSNPVAVAVDAAGDLLIADNGDQSVVEMAVSAGDDYGTPIGAGQAETVVGMIGNGNTPYLSDGLSATGSVSELNDPEGLVVSPGGVLFVTDGSQHCIRVVPNSTSEVFGTMMTGGDMYTLAGALPVTNSVGTGDGTRWILTQMGDPVGIALSSSGGVIFGDRSTNQVREIR